MSQEPCSANRADQDGERRADRHKHGLAFRGAALQELGGERKSKEEYFKGERDGEGAALALTEAGTKSDEYAVDQQVDRDRRRHDGRQPRIAP